MIHKEKQIRGERIRKRMTGLTIALSMVLLAACAGFYEKEEALDGPSPSPSKADIGFTVARPDSYDSADTAILVARDPENSTLTFLNLELGRRYTLSLDGTTRLYDKYGDSVTLEQIQTGDIVDITFLKTKKHLTTMQISSQAWVYTDVERYEINPVRSEVTIGSQIYKITSNTQYLSGGRNIESMDLNVTDVLTFMGIGNQVLTIRVDKGHGYLRLENDEKFVDGWIEIGQALIQRITEDMLLVVPEGSYQVNITNRGGGGVKNVVIKRNEETLLDIGDLEIPEPQHGVVLFSLDPVSAELYIDGNKVDPSGPIDLEYGLHQLITRATGYRSITQYIRVAQPSVGINITLEINDSEKEDTSETDTDQTTTDYYKIYIDAPEGVEVYFDGNYVGITPCSFAKRSGAHVVTLRKTGYTTRSYTITVDEEAKDISYSFADLVDSTSALDSSVSDNMWDQILDLLN